MAATCEVDVSSSCREVQTASRSCKCVVMVAVYIESVVLGNDPYLSRRILHHAGDFTRAQVTVDASFDEFLFMRIWRSQSDKLERIPFHYPDIILAVLEEHPDVTSF